MTDQLTDRDRRLATSAAQVLDDMPDMVLVVQFNQPTDFDGIREAIGTLLGSPAVDRVGVAPLAEGDPQRRR